MTTNLIPACPSCGAREPDRDGRCTYCKQMYLEFEKHITVLPADTTPLLVDRYESIASTESCEYFEYNVFNPWQQRPVSPPKSTRVAR